MRLGSGLNFAPEPPGWAPWENRTGPGGDPKTNRKRSRRVCMPVKYRYVTGRFTVEFDRERCDYGWFSGSPVLNQIRKATRI